MNENVGQFNDDEANRIAVSERHRQLGVSGNLQGECRPDSAAFKKLVNQWGFALAPNSLYPARTTGFGGFEFSIQAAYSRIDNSKPYWLFGTEGERDPNTGQAALAGSPPGVISLYGLNIRKSFPFGFEALANVGFVPDSSIINGGVDVRLSLLEGFREGIGGVFPDIAAGAGIRTITGTDQMQLTTVALDARISKPIPIASSSILSPWIGYQYVWIFGRSGLIDLTPGTDPLGYCGFTGTSIPSNSSASPPYDGQPVCAGGAALDFNNNVVFDEANLERQRLLVGLGYQYELFSTGVQFMTDVVDPGSAQNSDEDAEDLRDCDANGDNCTDSPRQWQLALEVGVAF